MSTWSVDQIFMLFFQYILFIFYLSCFNSVDDKMNGPLQSLQTGNQLVAFIYNLFYIVDQILKSYPRCRVSSSQSMFSL